MARGSGLTTRGLLLLPVAVLAFVACDSSGGSAASTTSSRARPAGETGRSLEGPTWTLRDPGALAPVGADTVVTIRFDAGTVSGSTGCNVYGATYRLEGAELVIDRKIAMTAVGCVPDLTALEREYVERLGRVARYAVEGKGLTLSDARGRARLRYTTATGVAALTGRWNVVNLHTGDALETPIAGSALSAEFRDATVDGRGGCNQFSGPFEVSSRTISIGPLRATMMACASEALTTQEQHYLAALQAARTYAVAGSRLELFRADGGIAVLFGRDSRAG